MVRSGVSFFGAFGGGGCGTMASRPLGVSGVITMKMISRTSNTSMSGVTLIFALWPPLGPTAIPIMLSLRSFGALLPGGRWRGRVARLFFLVGQQAQVVHAGGADIIHYLHHGTELRPRIGADIDSLVGTRRNAVFNLIRQLIRRNLIIAK